MRLADTVHRPTWMAKSDINKIDMALCGLCAIRWLVSVRGRSRIFHIFSFISFIFKGAKLVVIYGLLKY